MTTKHLTISTHPHTIPLQLTTRVDRLVLEVGIVREGVALPVALGLVVHLNATKHAGKEVGLAMTTVVMRSRRERVGEGMGREREGERERRSKTSYYCKREFEIDR